MNYPEEQNNEIEALESIYYNELTILERLPIPIFQITITTQSDKRNLTNASCTIQFSLPEKYPDVIPVMEIIDYEHIEDKHTDQLLQHMHNIASDNKGMVMIFLIVSSSQEFLTDLLEKIANEKFEEKEKIEQAREAAEMQRFLGTKVSVETFMNWKRQFDAELLEIKRAKIKEETGPKKLTGLELFMKDHAMDDSDVKLLEEGEEVVEVDESLFQDIEDIDFKDEDDDEYFKQFKMNNFDTDD